MGLGFKKIILLAGAILLCPGILLGQTADLQRAKEMVRSGDFPAAVELYQTILKKHPGHLEASLGLADSKRLSGDYSGAVAVYQPVITNPSVEKKHLKYFGQSLLLSGDYKGARTILDTYVKTGPVEIEARQWLAICDTLIQIASLDVSYNVFLLPFCTPANESAPALIESGLIFTSSRTDQGSVPSSHKQDLFFSEFKRKGDWDAFYRPEHIRGDIYRSHHEGALSWDSISNRAACTRRLSGSSAPRLAPDGDLSLEIYFMEYINGQWKNSEAFPFNSKNYSCAFPFLTDQGRTIYFSSDMPGGQGGFDIYRSTLNGSGWSQPENMGAAINSSGDEIYPYLHSDGVFYFSTNGKKSSRDLDIHIARPGANGQYENSIPFDSPINSASDDFAFIFEPDRRHGYFTSNREGGSGGDDIYSITIREPFIACKEKEEDVFCFRFYDKNDQGAMPTWDYRHEWEFGDGTKSSLKEGMHCFPGPGNYNVILTLTDTFFNEVFSRTEERISLRRISQAIITGPSEARAGEEVTLNAKESLLEGFRIMAYKWDFGDGFLANGESIKHKWAVPGEYTVTLKIAAINDQLRQVRRACTSVKIIVR